MGGVDKSAMSPRWRKLCTIAATKATSLIGHVVGKLGAGTVVTVGSLSTVALAPAASTPTLVETLINSTIPCEWVLGGDGQVMCYFPG